MSPSTKRPLKVGVFLPFAEHMMGGETPRWNDLVTLTQRAEAIGFDSVWIGDHLLARFEEPQSWLGNHSTVGGWSSWSVLAGLAAVTKRIELGPLVACTNFHNPAYIAKMADTIDEISNGRLILGLGAGWHEPEFRAYGFPFDHRVSRFAEAWTIIHTLLHKGQIDFEGQYYHLRECELCLRGPRPSGPPLLVGATGPRMLRITLPKADLWNLDTWDDSRPEDVRTQCDAVDTVCREVGRDPTTLGHTVGIAVHSLGEATPPDGSAHTGTPEMLASTLRSFAEAGVVHVQIWFRPNTLASIEAFAPVLELLDYE